MGRKNYLKQKEKGESHINFRPTGKKKTRINMYKQEKLPPAERKGY